MSRQFGIVVVQTAFTGSDQPFRASAGWLSAADRVAVFGRGTIASRDRSHALPVRRPHTVLTGAAGAVVGGEGCRDTRAPARGVGSAPPGVGSDAGLDGPGALHPRTSATGKQSDATNLLERLRDHADQYLRFTTDLHVPATNNLAERDQRPVKTQVKISGCHLSEAGARNWLDVRSYVSSARKHGSSAFDALRQAMQGTPWMPPIALAD